MMLHPDQMLELGRQRQDHLLASSEPFDVHPAFGRAMRLVRRQVGLALIRFGLMLGGHHRHSSPPVPISPYRT